MRGDTNVTVYDAAGNIILLVEGPVLPSHESEFVRSLRQRMPEMNLPRLPEMYAIIHGDERRGKAASFFNPDLTKERFCGNAVRCVAHLAAHKWRGAVSAIQTELGEVQLFCEGSVCGFSLPLDIVTVRPLPGGYLIDVGTPHRVEFVDDVTKPEIIERGNRISTAAAPLNATFVERCGVSIRARIFERGVGETRSCGSGAIAAALAVQREGRGMEDSSNHSVTFFSGEKLEVTLDAQCNRIALSGRAHCLMDCDLTTASAANDFNLDVVAQT
jgi:diaminopimelate epimerase